jgi:hypothetical protein
MKKRLELNAGFALISCAVLMIITMLSHPHADSLEGLLKLPSIVFKINMFTHTMGILSTPFLLFGCWGLSKYLKSNIALFAFVILALGVVAIIFAMTLDGFVTTVFINLVKKSTVPISQIDLIITYNSSIIKSFSLIYVFAICIAIILYSIVILLSANFPKWTGIYGLITSLSAMIAIFNGVDLVDFLGIKIFVFGLVSWTLIIGIILRKLNIAAKTV